MPKRPDAFGVIPEERFDQLITSFARRPGVTPPSTSRGFGSHALKVNGKIFAMLVRGRLVVKLPRTRVTALVDAGEGAHFDANKGTPMKEWFSADPGSTLDWEVLAGEALTFLAPK
jgi:hypothetical protein